jgi:hypothetical protein
VRYARLAEIIGVKKVMLNAVGARIGGIKVLGESFGFEKYSSNLSAKASSMAYKRSHS